jgi:hypothetical protein
MDKFKVTLIGSSSFNNPPILFAFLDSKKDKIDHIVSGGCHEFDDLIAEWCKKRGIPQMFFYPKNYNEDGTIDKGARFKNLHRIFKYATYAVFYYDGKSKGTADAIQICEQIGLKHQVIEFINEEKTITPSK